jgi:SWI/SNF-related matrix-associated actin-dependent regulator of chromatin subfamily A-like protein 1
VFIADEAHMLKNWKTKRSQTLIPILMNSKRVILISGTPIVNKPQEIFNLIKIARPDITPNFFDYAARYCDPKPTPYGIDNSGNSCLQELYYLLTSSIMIRRLK